jgi:hypothetical protein
MVANACGSQHSQASQSAMIGSQFIRAKLVFMDAIGFMNTGCSRFVLVGIS